MTRVPMVGTVLTMWSGNHHATAAYPKEATRRFWYQRRDTMPANVEYKQ